MDRGDTFAVSLDPIEGEGMARIGAVDTLFWRSPGGPPMTIHPRDLVGTWRRFGRHGPVYEILSLAAGAVDPSGDPKVRVRVVETGEELDYPLAHVLSDPVER